MLNTKTRKLREFLTGEAKRLDKVLHSPFVLSAPDLMEAKAYERIATAVGLPELSNQYRQLTTELRRKLAEHSTTRIER